MSTTIAYFMEGLLTLVVLAMATFVVIMTLALLHDVVQRMGGREVLRRLLLASAILIGGVILLYGIGYFMTEILDVSLVERLEKDGEQALRGFALVTSEES